MKRKNALGMLILVPLLLTSCGGKKEPVALDSDDYVESLAWENENFRLLQLSDLHWNYTTDIPKEKEYLSTLISETNPDFIVITGDSFLGANQVIVRELLTFIDSLACPYTFTWGNHDLQGLYSDSWLFEEVKKGQYSYFLNLDDEITGDANHIIDLKRNDERLWRIYVLDSNSYIPTGLTYDYNYIHDDQVEWFEAQSEKAYQEDGSYVPSLAFFHIPLWEWGNAYYQNKEGLLGEITESASKEIVGLTDGKEPLPFSPSSVHSSFFASAAEHGVQGMFVGHDHGNDWVTTYEDVVIGYGVKTGQELYYGVSENGYSLTGGSLMELHEDGSWDLTHYYLEEGSLELNQSSTMSFARRSL